MSWFKKIIESLAAIPHKDSSQKRGVPEGIWTKCPECHATLYQAELAKNLHVCPKCDCHMRLTARQRLASFLDAGGQTEIGKNISPIDHLKFRDTKRYKDRLAAAQKVTGEKDALVVIKGKLHRLSVVVAAFEFNFIGGSMGAVVGERFVRGVNASLQAHIPFICFSASGGARMQEGLLSLLQMAKTSAALGRLAQAGIPYISILTDPTTGGVSASLATLGDIIIAEPKALIGFAGPRVIQQTVRQTLPEGFQRSEFLLERGAIDMILTRQQLRDRVAGLLAKLTHQPAIANF